MAEIRPIQIAKFDRYFSEMYKEEYEQKREVVTNKLKSYKNYKGEKR